MNSMADLILLKDFLATQIELWRPVVGFTGYEVSNLGKVRSFWRTSGAGRSYVNGRVRGNWTQVIGDTPKILQPFVDKDGYEVVGLCRRGRCYRHRAHRLVADAFIVNDRPHIATKVNHLNNVHGDNRAPNLEWCTEKENRDHAIRIGVWPRGVKHGRSKLTVEQVLEIRATVGPETSWHDRQIIGARYGVSGELLRRIVKRLLWKQV
jgi:hypothetical protein